MEKINISSSFGNRCAITSSSNLEAISIDHLVQKMIRNNSMPGAFLPSRNYSEEIRHHAKEIVRKLEALLADPNLTDPNKRKRYETLLIKQKIIVNDSSVNDLFDVSTLPKAVYVMEPNSKLLEFFTNWFEPVWKDDDVRKKFERKKKVKAAFKEKSYYNRNKIKDDKKNVKVSSLITKLIGKNNEIK